MARLPSLAFLVAFLLASPLAMGALAEVRDHIQLPPQPNGQPNGFVGPAAIYLDGMVYIFGGRMKDGGTFSSAIYKYDPAAGTTTFMDDMPPGPGAIDGGRYQGALAALGGKLYYFGGATQVPVILPGRTEPENIPTSAKDVIEFDPATGTAVHVSAEMNHTSWGHAAVTYGNTIYIFGGFSFNIPGSEYGRYDTVQAFTVGTNPITGAPTYQVSVLDTRLPIEVSDMSVAVIDKRIYTFGGLAGHNSVNECPKNRRYNEETQQYEESQITICNTDAVIAFDPLDQKVKGVTARLPYKPQWSGAAAAKGDDGKTRAYIMGGQLPNYAASSSIIEFDPSKLSAPTRVLTPTLPSGTIAPGVATNGETILLIGGRSDQQLSMSDNVTFVDPGPTPPWAPRAPAAQKTSTGVRLTWDPPAYNGDSPILSYRVYRSVGGAEELLGTTTELTLADATVEPNVEYLYRITAVNAEGESKTSARAALTSEPTPPGPVSDLEAFPGNEEVLLRWSAPASDGGSNLTGYRVYRNGSALPILSLPASTLEARDAGLQNGVAYTYHVVAVNAKGDGARSDGIVVTPVAVPPAPALLSVTLETSTVRVSWDAPDVPVKGFTVLRGTHPADLEPVATLGPDARTFDDPEVERGNTYFYAVSAANDVGTSPPSALQSVSLVSKPGVPTNLIAAPGSGEIRLTWQRPTDTGEADPASVTYLVQRDGRLVAGDVRNTSYVDRQVVPNRNYTYAVIAYNGLQSDPSATARAAARMVENAAPTAVVAVLSSIVLAGDPVEMDASQSTDPDGALARFKWDFGDGTPPQETTTANVTHAYEKNGTYTIRLTVVDNRGAESEGATASLQVGQINANDRPGGGNGGDTETPPGGDRPGTETPKVPGPGLPVLLGIVALAALARRALHPRR